jgi:hypothetical protein
MQLTTGETRRYDAATGAFQAPRPFIPFTSAGGRGAWELALRYSHLDLDYHAGFAGTAATAGARHAADRREHRPGSRHLRAADAVQLLSVLHSGSSARIVASASVLA